MFGSQFATVIDIDKYKPCNTVIHYGFNLCV